jgi:2'-5' RNA ligase
LDEKLNKIGFEKEKRKFNPHLTLLRIKNNFPQELIDQFKKGDLNELVFIPFQIKLYESILKKSGSVYTAIKSFNL